MLKISSFVAAAGLTLIPLAIGQAPVWGQCGGQGFTGPTTATSTQGLNTAAKSSGGKLYLGTGVLPSEVDNYELNDPKYAATLNNNSIFGQITPKALRWVRNLTELNQSKADAMISLAKKNGQLVRGHSCVSYDEIPNWVNAGNFNSGQYHNILVNHCSTLIKRYAGQIYAWDVIKAPFTDDGHLRPFVFTQAVSLGSSYFDIALTAARAADPEAKLYISENNIDTPGPKVDSLLGEVQYELDHGTPIDGVGFVSHFIVGQVPSKADLISNYERFTSLGIEIAIVELDIAASESGANLLQQQADYQTVISACKAVAGCVGVTLSDITDKYSPIAGQYFGQGMTLPWDTNIIPRPAYDGIIAGFTN
ncbi:endo-1,4-B-xylanase A [Mycena polygramma]|nr:endo-1,4-B-xylanase A [Mycena polygramma]